MYDENLDTAFNLYECSSAWLTSLLFDSATFQMSQDQIDQILIETGHFKGVRGKDKWYR